MGYHDCLEKINTADARQVVPKLTWSSGTTYDMYEHDYSRSNTAPVSGATNLYSANFIVLNSDFRVYAAYKMGQIQTTLRVDHL